MPSTRVKLWLIYEANNIDIILMFVQEDRTTPICLLRTGDDASQKQSSNTKIFVF